MKKTFLHSLVVSVVLSAILGIFAILSGKFGWYEVRLLLTTITLTGASICGLASGAYLAKERGKILPLSGITLALIGAAMIVAGMWTELDSEPYWKLAISISVFAVACSHLSLLSMARLSKRFRWSLPAAYGVILSLACQIVLMILIEMDDLVMFQILGALAILASAFTILIPIFQKLSKPDLSSAGDSVSVPSEESIEVEIARLKERIAELESMRDQRS